MGAGQAVRDRRRVRHRPGAVHGRRHALRSRRVRAGRRRRHHGTSGGIDRSRVCQPADPGARRDRDRRTCARGRPGDGRPARRVSRLLQRRRGPQAGDRGQGGSSSQIADHDDGADGDLSVLRDRRISVDHARRPHPRRSRPHRHPGDQGRLLSPGRRLRQLHGGRVAAADVSGPCRAGARADGAVPDGVVLHQVDHRGGRRRRPDQLRRGGVGLEHALQSERGPRRAAQDDVVPCRPEPRARRQALWLEGAGRRLHAVSLPPAIADQDVPAAQHLCARDAALVRARAAGPPAVARDNSTTIQPPPTDAPNHGRGLGTYWTIRLRGVSLCSRELSACSSARAASAVIGSPKW